MHAVCAGLDHVAAATGEPQETVGIEVAEVAGAQPAVDQGRGGRLRRVPVPGHDVVAAGTDRSEEHTSELQSLMRISYAVFCLKKKKNPTLTNDIFLLPTCKIQLHTAVKQTPQQ